MSNVATVAPQTAEPPRDRWGRYMLPIPETGERKGHTRATTLAKAIADTYNLELWSQRMVVKGLAIRHEDLLPLAMATPLDDKKTLNGIAKDAKEAASASRGANIGTALHSFTEQIDRGNPVQAPAPFAADLAAYQARVARAGLEMHPWWIERVLYHPGLVAGTADRLVWINGHPYIADLKTGSVEYAWNEIALQLAIYARAPYWYDPATDQYGPTAEVGISLDRALVIHLPAGQARCSLWWVDIAAGWRAVQLAVAVREWRSRKDIAQEWT